MTAMQIEANINAPLVLKSGKYEYEIDPIKMKQRNTKPHTIRDIRRLVMLAEPSSALKLAMEYKMF